MAGMQYDTMETALLFLCVVKMTFVIYRGEVSGNRPR
jgi:hypothetical protein